MKRLCATVHLIAANLWCWASLFIISLAALLAAPFFLLAGRLRGWNWARVVRLGTWIYASLYLLAIRPFVRLRLHGAEKVVRHFPAVFAVNHQSWLDLYLMASVPSRNICLLIRAWPFKRLFFFRPLMQLADHVPTEGAEVADILGRCRREMAAGACILGFPEGTRSPDGSLGRFHSGLFMLALSLQRPLIPVIVKGSGRVMPKKSLIFRPGEIEILFEEPIDARQFAGEAIPHGALRRFVRQRFQSALKHIDPVIK